MIPEKLDCNGQSPMARFLLPKIFEALDHPLRQRILQLLQEHEELSYSEIRKSLAIPNTATLTYHLNVLLNAHLIKTRIDVDALKKRKGRQHYSFYSLTQFGKVFLDRFVALVKDTLREFAGELDDDRTKKVPTAP